MAEIQTRLDSVSPRRVADAPGTASFSQVLARTMAAPAGGGHVHARPPAELTVYGNGRIPSSTLVEVGRGDHLCGDRPQPPSIA